MTTPAAGAAACSSCRRSLGGTNAGATVGHELAVRAALDPAWDAVLAAYLDPPHISVARDPH